MKTLYTHKDGILSLKPERQELCLKHGVLVLGLGDPIPKDGILIADTRPKGFIGGRGPSDPAATMLYVGGWKAASSKLYFEDFTKALNKALKLSK